MSVNLTITRKSTDETIAFIPVSGQESFVKYWQPLAKKLNLDLVAGFDNGWTYRKQEHIHDVISQLRTFQATLQSSSPSDIPADKIRIVLENISYVLEALEKLPDDPDIAITIG